MVNEVPVSVYTDDVKKVSRITMMLQLYVSVEVVENQLICQQSHLNLDISIWKLITTSLIC